MPWGRTTWLVPLLLFAAVLLVAGLAFNMAHLDTGGEAIPSVPAPSSPQQPSGPVASDAPTSILFTLALFALFIVGLVLMTRRRKHRGPTKPLSVWDIFGSLLGLGLFLVLILLWPYLVGSRGTNATANATAPNGGAGFIPPSLSGIPAGVFLAGALLGALIVIALLVRGNATLRRRAEPGPPKRPSPGAIAAVEEAIEELALGMDVRGAILACYQRFCGLLGAWGIVNQETLTPRELETLAVQALHVPPDASGALTSLFEEARYSVHPLGERERERAVRSLEGIRAALGG